MGVVLSTAGLAANFTPELPDTGIAYEIEVTLDPEARHADATDRAPLFL